MTRAYNTATTQQNSGGAVAGVTAGKNAVINGGFDIWQRGTSLTASVNGGVYAADRWFGTRGSNTSITVSRQTTSDTTNLPNIQYCARVQRTAASTTTADVAFGQMFESVSSIPLAGQTVTLSGYIRKGADFSATSNVLTMQVITGTGTDQKQMDGGYTGSSTSIAGNVTLTTTWTRFSVTGTIPTTATELTPKFVYTPTGTAGTNDYFEVTGVQLEVGSVATPFSRAGGTIAGELAACQRYCYRYTPASGNGYERIGVVYYLSSTRWIQLNLPVPMRVYPNSLTTSGAFAAFSSAHYTFSNLAISTTPGGSLNVIMLNGTSSVTDAVSLFEFEGNANGFLILSAEL